MNFKLLYLNTLQFKYYCRLQSLPTAALFSNTKNVFVYDPLSKVVPIEQSNRFVISGK